MTNYILLCIGCFLVGLAYQDVFPVIIGNTCNVIGIMFMVYGIIWDKW